MGASDTVDRQRPAANVARFPALTTPLGSWRLPLADHVGWELLRILTRAGRDDRTQALAELMALDPAFVLWVVCQADCCGSAEPRSVIDLAEWFVRTGWQYLTLGASGTESPSGKKGATRRALRTRCQELSASGVAVATIASDLAAGDLAAAESFLFGLLHNALDWLRAVGTRVPVADADASCLPEWLVARLRQRSKGGRDAVGDNVARAVALWRHADHDAERVGATDLTDVRRVRHLWRASGTPPGAQAAALLPVLLGKLLRLEQLECRFRETLEQEKLEALGELAYGASHEINNPLANISTRAQTLLRDEADPERRRTLAVINTQAFRANEMIADMMLFARPPRLDRTPTELVAIAQQVINELTPEAELQGTQLRLGSSGPNLLIAVDPTQLSVALRAVCLNAVQAIGAGGEVEISILPRVDGARTPGRWHCIAVRDTGPGITDEVRRHLFDPFFSGREAGRGLGFGLSKCWRIITEHGGYVEVDSVLEAGTTMRLWLPE